MSNLNLQVEFSSSEVRDLSTVG